MITTSSFDLLTVMENSKHENVKELAKKIKKMLTIEINVRL